MPRILPPDPNTMNPRQREVHDAIATGPRGGVRGPLAVWLHRPELADHAQALGRYCRYETALPPRLSELAILTTARIWNSEYEWAAHKPIALKAGLSAEVIEAVRTGNAPPFSTREEAIVHSFTQTLHTERKVSPAIYNRAVELLGEPAVVDLTGLLGYYTLISMTINVFEVSPPDGAVRELS